MIFLFLYFTHFAYHVSFHSLPLLDPRKQPLGKYTTKIFSNMPWCSGHHYCTTSFSKAWFQVLRRFKSYLRRIVDSRWWGSLAMVLAGNKAKRLSPLNHTTKTINHHHHLHLYPKVTWRSSSFSSVVCSNLTNLLNWIPRVFFNNFSHAVT